ncbi:hsp70 family chaperone [Colletotrichum sojae]|uniref:Hsp70 family chaperone n=1 Tax=Colletotrichum sojae TaxID=2175907 RepID=A0A8H6JF98_9PEZI|nr:hsp70 family chaperone [Colletotrichum sojae]
MSIPSKPPQTPDLNVGVDFRFTAHGAPSPKVPSAVFTDEDGRPASWGYGAIASNQGGSTGTLVTLFKTWIESIPDFDVTTQSSGSSSRVAGSGSNDYDRTGVSGAGGEPSDSEQSHQQRGISTSHAVDCLGYFLSGLYMHIRETLEDKLSKPKADWDSARIWFLFSYPATWGDSTIYRFQHAVEPTKFHLGRHHVVPFYLKEAQAAMASFFAEEERLDANHNVLVADMGGSTTDVSMFAVDNDDGRRGTLDELSTSDAEYSGSARIDRKVSERLSVEIEHTLAASNNQSFKQMSPEEKLQHTKAESHRLIKETDYIDAKHNFRSGRDSSTIRFAIRVRQQPQRCVPVLTGGLSNNKYVVQQLEARAMKHRIEHVGVPLEPELSVSKGLVWDALATVESASFFLYKTIYHYGIVFSTADGNNNAAEPMIILPRDEIVNIKKTTKTGVVRFPRTGDGQVDLRLVRWVEMEDKGKAHVVGSLTDGTASEQKWKRIPATQSVTRPGKRRADVEITFERRTMAVTLKGDGTAHKRVFNEKWHRGVAHKSISREGSSGLMQLFAPVMGVLGLVIHLITAIVNVGSGESGTEEETGATDANGKDEDPEE